jgi:DNA-binding helix-hairpin-helix protein with protein kinase domain
METTTRKKTAETSAKKQQTVRDEHGHVYVLGEKLAEGGQGLVLRIEGQPRLLLKISRLKDPDPKALALRRQLDKLRYLPIEDLQMADGGPFPLAMPKTLLAGPRPGYVMELMDGLVPLGELLETSQQALLEGDGRAGFVRTGGLKRRMALLARLARVLAKLHGVGIAHGDLSPNNVFVSSSHEHAQVWLIDCDNLTYAVRNSSLQIHTPDYGAPELLRGELGISTYTDIWSFAVMAFQLLTLLHPLKSGLLADSNPETEDRALRGELPWIDHPVDDSNRAEAGVSRDWVLTPALQTLFERCFNAGLSDAAQRPLMAEWAEAFEAAHALLVRCEHEDCASSFFWKEKLVCPFCGESIPSKRWLLLEHKLLCSSVDLPDFAAEDERCFMSGWQQTVGDLPIHLRNAPPGSAGYTDSPTVARLWIDEKRLVIQPLDRAKLRLDANAAPSERIRGRIELPTSRSEYRLHLGDITQTHDLWRFKW